MSVGAIEDERVVLFRRQRGRDVVIVVGGKQLSARDDAEFVARFRAVSVVDVEVRRFVANHRGEIGDVNNFEGVEILFIAAATEEFREIEGKGGRRSGDNNEGTENP